MKPNETPTHPPLILSSFLISCEKKEQLNFTYPSGSIYEGEWLEQ
jgi:hypothetical protein